MSACDELVLSGSRNVVVQKWDTSTAEAVGPPIKRVLAICVATRKDSTLIVSGDHLGTAQR